MGWASKKSLFQRLDHPSQRGRFGGILARRLWRLLFIRRTSGLCTRGAAHDDPVARRLVQQQPRHIGPGIVARRVGRGLVAMKRFPHRVLGAVDNPHAAAAQPVNDAVMRERPADQRCS